MDIREMLDYYNDPNQKAILKPLVEQVGYLTLRVLYSAVSESDLDLARVLVYNAGIKCSFLSILAEGNPEYLEEVSEQAYNDLASELRANLQCLEADVLFNQVDLAERLSPDFWDDFFNVAECDPNDDMPVFDSKELDQEEIAYLWDEFGVAYDEDPDLGADGYDWRSWDGISDMGDIE